MPGELKVLTSRHLPDLLALVDRDPVTHCFVASRLADPMDPWALGGLVWGWFEAGRLRSAMYTGANLIPIETTPLARASFADNARRLGRRCSSLVGPADEVLDLWRLLAPAWGPAREVRSTQYLMATTAPATRPAHPGLRALRIDELDLLMPAAVAMFTEEVGMSPVAHGGGSGLPRPAGGDRPDRTGPGRGRGGAPDLQGRGRVGHRTGLPDPGGLGRPRTARARARRRRHGRRRRARPQPHRADRLPVRQRLQPRRRRHLPRVGFQTVGTFATVLF